MHKYAHFHSEENLSMFHCCSLALGCIEGYWAHDWAHDGHRHIFNFRRMGICWTPVVPAAIQPCPCIWEGITITGNDGAQIFKLLGLVDQLDLKIVPFAAHTRIAVDIHDMSEVVADHHDNISVIRSITIIQQCEFPHWLSWQYGLAAS